MIDQPILGLDLDEGKVGGADSANFYGQFNLTANLRSDHAGAYLSELASQLERLLKRRKYRAIGVESAEYGINASSFVMADRRARMIGIVSMVASQRDIEFVEVSPKEVCSMATGRKRAGKFEFLKAACANGVQLKSEHIAQAYWVMLTAQKKLNS